jgi:hypothetical protein
MNKNIMELSKNMATSLSKSLLANEKPVFFENEKIGAQAEKVTEKKMLSKLVLKTKPELFQYPDLEDVDPFSDMEIHNDEIAATDEDENQWLNEDGLNRRRRLQDTSHVAA